MSTSRRDFLRGAATVVVAAAVVGSVRVDRLAALDRRAAVPRARSRGDVAKIGRRYLELTPTEGTRAALAPLLPGGATNPNGEIDWSVIAQSTSDEFARGDVVVIDGWYLARSEARAAAYVVAR
jgi:hypothetical protein